MKDRRYNSHPTENNITREGEESNSLGTQYHVINYTRRRRNQKVTTDEDGQIQVEPYPKFKQKKTIEKTKVDIECPQGSNRN